MARKAADSPPHDYCCQVIKNIRKKQRVIFRVATSNIANVTEIEDSEELVEMCIFICEISISVSDSNTEIITSFWFKVVCSDLCYTQ